MKKILLILIILLVGCVQQTVDISGTWQSKTIEDGGSGAFALRNFVITDTDWSVTFIMYGDNELKYPLFAFNAEGPYSIDSKSDIVKDAHEAMFRFDKKTLTLLTSDEDTINSLGFSDCNLEKNVPKDISETGCSFLTSVSACAQEYDLVKIEGNVLHLGARPADGNMCTEDKRPTALGNPLVKQ